MSEFLIRTEPVLWLYMQYILEKDGGNELF